MWLNAMMFDPHLTGRRRCWLLSARRTLTSPCWSCRPLRRRRPRTRWLCWSGRKTDWCSSSNSRWGGGCCMIEGLSCFFHLSFLLISHTEYVKKLDVSEAFQYHKSLCYHQTAKFTSQIPVNFAFSIKPLRFVTRGGDYFFSQQYLKSLAVDHHEPTKN